MQFSLFWSISVTDLRLSRRSVTEIDQNKRRLSTFVSNILVSAVGYFNIDFH